MTSMPQQLRPANPESPETIPDIFVSYLRATGDADRRSVVQAHPSLFPEPVVEALNDAHREFRDTMREVKEACRMIDAVSGSLEYTGASMELQPGEARTLLDEETLFHNFATSLAALLEAREKQGTVLRCASAATATTSSTAGAAAVPSAVVSLSHEAGGDASQRGPWFAQPALVLSVLSFLPAGEVFMEAENVCRSWQTWLFEPQVSRFFWVGCVQREFPRQLAILLQTEGEDLFQSDWRSLAMLCVTEAEAELGVED